MEPESDSVKIARLEERIKAADKALSVASDVAQAHSRSTLAVVVAVLSFLGMIVNWVALLKK